MDNQLLESLMNDPQFADIMSYDVLSEGNDSASKDGFYDTNGKWNSLIKVNGKNYRERVEILVIQNDAVFIAKYGDGKKYKIPGGSTEKEKTPIQQVIAECEEEAYFTPKNVKYVTQYKVDYTEKNPCPFKQDHLPVKYDGYIAKVYVGNYGNEYSKYVELVDRDSVVRSGRFIPIRDTLKFVRPEHKKVLQEYLNK